MTQTLTNRVKAIKNTPGTGETVDVAEINAAFDKFDNSFVPSAKMYLNTGVTTQTLTNNVSATHDYDTIDYDTYAARSEGAMADLALNRIVIRKAGVYHLSMATGYNGNATGVRRASIHKNSVAIAHFEAPGLAGFVAAYAVAVDEICAVNDVITCVTIQTSGGNLDVANGGFLKSAFLSATWMGAAVEV